jgi:hypothetical protein
LPVDRPANRAVALARRVLERSTMMTKLSIPILFAFGCAANPSSPMARQQAVLMYANGASCDEIANRLEIDRTHARELIRTGMADLSRKFYKAR